MLCNNSNHFIVLFFCHIAVHPGIVAASVMAGLILLVVLAAGTAMIVVLVRRKQTHSQSPSSHISRVTGINLVMPLGIHAKASMLKILAAWLDQRSKKLTL